MLNGATVIVLRNRIQIMDKHVCISLSTNAFKAWIYLFCSPIMVKIVGLGFVAYQPL